ncbi:TetR/AcrR family transcriptional regulator [Azorhizobium caulinodans]|uniref:TetR/AcrR family transcriptional regulator n=1 Tax=Azorhizobium caulinodans TaxID=7 RepID=UPI002FBD6859
MQAPSSSASAELPARDRILRAAQTLFYGHGVRATGIDRIIAEAGVTKVTVYRHFPSKDDLIRAYLVQRHDTWMAWFKAGLTAYRAAQSPTERRTRPLMPVLEVARDWFGAPTFRGCAFANAIAEVGESVASVAEIAARHKAELRDAIADLLPANAAAPGIAWAATLALDGAIMNAQTGAASIDAALQGLNDLLDALNQSHAAMTRD